MKLDEGRKHVLYDMCLHIIGLAQLIAPDDLQEVIVSLRREADHTNEEDAKALRLIAEALAPYIDL